MKIKTAFLPLIMVSALVACDKQEVHYVSRSQYIAQAEINEAKENPYHFAILEYKYTYKRMEMNTEHEQSTYYFTTEDGESWEASSSEGDTHLWVLYDLASWDRAPQQDEMDMFVNDFKEAGGKASVSLKFTASNSGVSFQYKANGKSSDELRKNTQQVKHNSVGLMTLFDQTSYYKFFDEDGEVTDEEEIHTYYKVTYEKEIH